MRDILLKSLERIEDISALQFKRMGGGRPSGPVALE